MAKKANKRSAVAIDLDAVQASSEERELFAKSARPAMIRLIGAKLMSEDVSPVDVRLIMSRLFGSEIDMCKKSRSS